jgi:hypothetical protein
MLGLELSPVVSRWLVALLLTLIIETPIYALVGRRHATVSRCILGGVLGTLITHPLLWFVWQNTFDNYLLRTITGELAVCLVEGVVLWAVARPINFNTALAISLLANGASYGIGILLHIFHIL